MRFIQEIVCFFSFLLVITLISFFIYGSTHLAPTSIDNSWNIIQSILHGTFWHLESSGVYDYYPGSSYAIIAFLLTLKVPVNLVGLISWIVLFFSIRELGRIFGLQKTMSFILAASFCTVISVIRTIADQSIDKWLCTWFILSVVLFERIRKDWRYSIYLGITLGMLIGSKYSGPLYFLALVPIYGKTFIQFITPLRFLIITVFISLLGLFWYVRNYFMTGSPYYPGDLHMPFFRGQPGNTVQDWMVWRIPFVYPDGILPMVNAFLSEYIIWAFAGFILLGYVIFFYRKKRLLDTKIKRVFGLSLTTGLVSLLLPISPPYYTDLYHTISNMRYIYIFVLMTMLGVFLIAEKHKKNELLAKVAFLNALPLLSFLPYQPKIILGVLTVALVLFLRPVRKLNRVRMWLGLTSVEHKKKS